MIRKSFIIWAASILSVAMLLATVTLSPTVYAETIPTWSQAVIDKAVSEELVAFTRDLSWGNNILETSQAMYLLSLMSFYNPNLESTGGKRVSDRLAEHIRNMINGGKEPGCRGGIAGWADNAAAQSLVMAKNTPAVWNRLTADEKAKCDFLMKCLTVSGNYCQNYVNDPCRDLSQSYEWKKDWNPNHEEGYVGIMIAAYLYFGGSNDVNNILKNFSYDDYISVMNAYGFTNAKTNFSLTGKKLLENGGTDAGGGQVRGVKMDFTYKDTVSGKRIPYDPFMLYKALANKMYYFNVASTIYDGKGYIKDGTVSPYEGLYGMAYEFCTGDASGQRTSASYVFDGWRNSVITRATLKAMNCWETGSDVKDIEGRMYVGSEDLIYKLVHGYCGWSNGKAVGPDYEFGYSMGYNYVKEIWRKYLSTGVQMALCSDDAYIRNGSYAKQNYGTADSLAVKKGGGSEYDRDTLLKFDLGTVVQPVQSALLRLYVPDNNITGTVDVYSVVDDTWSENTIIWENAPAKNTKLASVSIQKSGWVSIDVTDYIKSKATGNQKVSFRLMDDSGSNKYVPFNSKERVVGQPILQIQYDMGNQIPESPPIPDYQLEQPDIQVNHNKVTVEGHIVKNVDDNIVPSVLVAAYDADTNALIDVKIVPTVNEYNCELYIPNKVLNYIVKVMLWKTIQEMQPLTLVYKER